MRIVKSASWALPLIAFALIVSPATASADDIECDGRIGARTVGDIVVPKGETCRLVGTKVRGSIEVEDRARLRASSVLVTKDVDADDARQVRINKNSRVRGDVEIEDGGSVMIVNSRIDGRLKLEDNDKRVVVENNRIGGKLKVEDNDGGVRIAGNTIGGDLDCEDNDPRPTGGNNTVKGDKEGQCRSL